jgi:hypothetical protein
MNKDQLVALREKLLAEITPLVIENAGDGVDRFSLLLRVIQGGHATNDIYAKAFESANAIDGNPDKLEALLALLDEVEVDLNRDADDVEAELPDEVPQPIEPQTEDHDPQPEQHEQYNHEHHDQQ